MSLFSIFRVRTKAAIEKDWKQQEKESVRNIVAKLSRGNLTLQRGRYRTKEDIDKLRKKILKHKF